MPISQWSNKGLIWDMKLLPPEWAKSHMAVPVLEHLHDDIYRAYFCSRDEKNRSQIGFLDFNINAPRNPIRISSSPILKFGELGHFDDSGVTPTWVLNKNGQKYLYYVGWSQGVSVRMYLYVGLAVSDDGGKSFKRIGNVPILERSSNDPCLTATLSILEEDGIYRMWYVSGDKWEMRADGSYPYYNIKYAESIDGVNWRRERKICIDYKNKNEHAIAKPCVIKDGAIYKMWYSCKGEDYSIGYAESCDGFSWERKDDKLEISQSSDGFDSRMREYAHVIEHKGKKFMFFNGNEYGRHGIGMAEEL